MIKWGASKLGVTNTTGTGAVLAVADWMYHYIVKIDKAPVLRRPIVDARLTRDDYGGGPANPDVVCRPTIDAGASLARYWQDYQVASIGPTVWDAMYAGTVPGGAVSIELQPTPSEVTIGDTNYSVDTNLEFRSFHGGSPEEYESGDVHGNRNQTAFTTGELTTMLCVQWRIGVRNHWSDWCNTSLMYWHDLPGADGLEDLFNK